ncbi:hypothetical protein [Lacibacter sediminis]|uniref:Uncharacterized protein n=1 Tax=Lacibacter sediminis TaxID=2760713 RepID=A0A7G5XGV1_9BACT|nr:hypothetical protein [Lacibacter sediminis]QNA44704.1 hypothetical protein H4075_00465 [Lacibacter sediminis]
MFKLSRLQGISLFYAATLLLFTVYWSQYYHTYATKKGEELFIALEVLLFVSFFYFVVLQISIAKTNWVLTLLLPIINGIISFLFTVVILWLGSFDGNPKEDILIFGIVYIMLCVLAGLVLWNKTE